MTRTDLSHAIKVLAYEVGFDKVGFAEARPTGEASHLQSWLAQGFHGTMEWMARNTDLRLDPTRLFPGAKSVVALAMNYQTSYQHSPDSDHGCISRYAWGDDYHDVLKQRMQQMLTHIRKLDPEIEGRCCVDTAPLQDKFWAVQAGLGWLGKHSNVISRDLGSWIFLGEIILNVELDYDTPQPDYCGSCRRCIDICPTAAIVQPYVVDATKCISYWTIEHRGEIDPAIGELTGNRIFGCDDCQDVCPWNIKFSRPTQKPEFQPRAGLVRPNLSELDDLTEEAFRRNFRKSPIKRSKYAGFRRNVTVALKNHAKSIKK